MAMARRGCQAEELTVCELEKGAAEALRESHIA